MKALEEPHLSLVRPVTPLTPEGCQECLELGTDWVHLRLCLTCGHVGCCDSSPMRHARAHARALSHPIVQSLSSSPSSRVNRGAGAMPMRLMSETPIPAVPARG